MQVRFKTAPLDEPGLLPARRSKVEPSIRSSLRVVTRRKAAVDTAEYGGSASSLAAGRQ